MIRIWIQIIILGFAAFANAKENIKDGYRSYTDTALLVKDCSKEHKFILVLDVANDMTYFTDHYFSSGIAVCIFAPFMGRSPLKKILLGSKDEAEVYNGLTLVHHLYTPIYIDTLTQRKADHPFAAYFLIGDRRESFDPNQGNRLISELQAGLIGPVAGGRGLQNTLHDHISIAGPVKGWDNQIGNDLCVQYSILWEKKIVGGHRFGLNGLSGVKLGVPHTEAEMGVCVRAGHLEDYFSSIGVHPNRKWQIRLFCQGDINIIGYNAVLQGGLLNQRNKNTLGEINHLLYHTAFGGSLAYKNIRVEIAQEVISPSFQSALWHRWAYCQLTVGF